MGGKKMINRVKKALSLVTAIAMTISLFAMYPTAKVTAQNSYKTYKPVDGTIMVELEDTIVAGEFVAEERVKEASGRTHVKLNGWDSTAIPAKDLDPALAFNFSTASDGKHKIWLRYRVLNGSENSCFWSFGAEDAEYKEKPLNPVSEHETDYRWLSDTFTAKKGEIYTIRYRPREVNTVLDKVIITNDTLYRPQGVGEMPDGNLNIEKLPEDKYPIPTVTPPPEHPRVLFRASDIPNIIANIESAEMAVPAREFYKLRDTECTGVLPDKNANYDGYMLSIIQAKAFDYAIYGNEAHGQEAVDAIKNYYSSLSVEGMGDKTRNIGHTLYIAAEVYDWCYPLLTERDKQEIVMQAQFFAAQMEVSFPPDRQSIVFGHGAEWQMFRDWLSLAIASYDEYPDIYNFVAGKIFSGAAEWKNWWYKSGATYQGPSYGAGRVEGEMWAQWLLYRMAGVKLFSDDVGRIYEENIYKRRPDGQNLRDGDERGEELNDPGSFWMAYGADAPFTIGNFYKNGMLKKEFFKYGGYSAYSYDREGFSPIDMLILEDRSVKTQDFQTLPLTKYFGEPVGEMIARTGWGMGMKSPDVVAQMKIGCYNGQDHKHFDSGNFQIYYKGILASESGYYETDTSPHNRGYMFQTYAHNSMLIGSPSNPGGAQNVNVKGKGYGTTYWDDISLESYRANPDNEYGEVIGAEFGPDLHYPEYSYIAGDIAQAYDIAENNAYGVKATHDVEEAVRSMIFLPTGNEKNPAAFVVFDRIQTKQGGYKKSFLLHMQEEPTVEGNVTTIKRTEGDYSGKLVNQTLLPEKAKIEKIGGPEKRFWAEGENWFLVEEYEARGEIDKVPSSARGVKFKQGKSIELGWGRVEISPPKTEKEDYFLNVMYVGDATDESAVEKATLIEAGNFVGTKIFDRVVMFNKNKARTKDTVTFNIPSGHKEMKVNVAGLEAGTWAISVNGAQIDTQVSSEEGGIVYFSAPAGECTLKYISTDANKQFEQSPPPEVEGVTIFISKGSISNYLYSDVAPTIRNGRTLIPMRALLEAMDAKVEWNEATATAIADNGVTRIQITENSKTAYVDGEPVELDVPAMIIDGRFVIPVRFISENLGCVVSWDEFAQQVKITINKVTPGCAPVVGAVGSGEESATRSIMASIDDNFDTYWGVQGEGEWGVYDLGRAYTLDKVMLCFSMGDERVYTFDIDVSEDGVNYTNILRKAQTAGKYTKTLDEAFDLGGVKARYVRFTGYGNSTNKWNTIQEIKFKIKR